MWSGGKYNPNQPDAHEYLPEIRRLIFEDRVEEAFALEKRTPDLFQGARATLEARGDASTGWSMAWKSCFWARLGDGPRSHKLYRMLIQRGAPNLFCLHPPFQIDGNFGGTAAVAEMLLQCQSTDAKGQRVLHLLPALPPAWHEGRVNGLRTRGGHRINLAWKQNQAPQLEITGGRDETVTLRHGTTTRDLQLTKGKTLRVEL